MEAAEFEAEVARRAAPPLERSILDYTTNKIEIHNPEK
jgi:hypothetical protein